MSFAPVIPVGCYAGWRFLARTADTQKAAFQKSPEMARDVDYFRENIGKITSAEALVADRRLLRIALGAFGLEGDVNNSYFIQKVLSDGTLDETALANRIADKSYHKMSKAFGFGDFSTPNTQLSDFPDKILSAFQSRSFEIAIGEQNPDMRLAMNAVRELADITAGSGSDDTKWFTVMGSEPLRKVFETALGLPESFAALDIDQQLTIFRDRAARTFGNGEISQFQDPENTEALVRRFLIQADLKAFAASFSPAATALTLLQAAMR